MVEMELDNRIVPGKPSWRIFLLFVFAAFLVWCVWGAVWYQDPNNLFLALVPFVVVVYLLFTWPSRNAWHWEEDGLRLENSDEFIPFSEIQGLVLGGGCQDAEKPKRSGWLAIHYSTGALFLPPNVRPSGKLLYQSLLEKVPLPSGGPECSKLKKFHQQQVEIFGPEKVFGFNPRVSRDHEWYGKGLLLFWGVMFVLGVGGIAWGVHEDQKKDFIGLGTVVVMASIMGIIIPLDKKWRAKTIPLGVKNWKDSGLVIGPGGIAMAQGKDTGILKWEEVRGVKLGRFFALANINRYAFSRTLYLQVKGAEICIVDIYNCPLAKIHQLILRYWKPPVMKNRA